jgi:hypothetical protein
MSVPEDQRNEVQDQSGYGATEESEANAPPQEQPQRPEQPPNETPGEIRNPDEIREPIEVPAEIEDRSEAEELGPGGGAG